MVVKGKYCNIDIHQLVKVSKIFRLVAVINETDIILPELCFIEL